MPRKPAGRLAGLDTLIRVVSGWQSLALVLEALISGDDTEAIGSLRDSQGARIPWTVEICLEYLVGQANSLMQMATTHHVDFNAMAVYPALADLGRWDREPGAESPREALDRLESAKAEVWRLEEGALVARCKIVSRQPDVNAFRNEYMRQRWNAGAPLREIRKAVRKIGWPPLGSDRAVHTQIRRHCQKHSLPMRQPRKRM